MKILNKLPLTRIKIFFAKILYRGVKFFYKEDLRTISRGGITYEIDLSEGLDLSLFLFGNFQSHVSKNKYLNLEENAVIFDIGANVGVMTLQFSQMVPKGKVYAFEPTHYAYKKLTKNVSLNPQLAERIQTIQTFVTSPEKKDETIIAYSSWKIDGSRAEKQHPIHGGTNMSTEGVGAITLDDFCEKENIQRIDFVKIDTDGHEPDVFAGAKNTVSKFRPKIIFEIGLYVMKERGIEFSFYNDYFTQLNYMLYNSKNLKLIDINNYDQAIPQKGTIDIIAIPN